MYRLIVCLVLLALFAGCGIREREAAVEKREAILAQKEQELIIREQELVKDSITTAKPDSATVVEGPANPAIKPGIDGTWNVKMVCKETTCPGSAIGDTKNEYWTFDGDSTGIIAKVMAGNKLVRVYRGTLEGKTLIMTNVVGETVQAGGAKINVRINLEGEKTRSGLREILREDNCKILYELKLEKQTL